MNFSIARLIIFESIFLLFAKKAAAKAAKEKAKSDSKERSIAKQLREVNELYQSGALTEKEFKEAKEQIINQ